MSVTVAANQLYLEERPIGVSSQSWSLMLAEPLRHTSSLTKEAPERSSIL